MKLQAIRDRRPRTTNKVTISVERFKTLYTIVHAARNNDEKLLAKALKTLKAIEVKDFMTGVE